MELIVGRITGKYCRLRWLLTLWWSKFICHRKVCTAVLPSAITPPEFYPLRRHPGMVCLSVSAENQINK
jgi:hypothetical protein